jgi:hypothetical protein
MNYYLALDGRKALVISWRMTKRPGCGDPCSARSRIFNPYRSRAAASHRVGTVYGLVRDIRCSSSARFTQASSTDVRLCACALRCLADTRELEATAAHAVAQDLWPETIVGPASLYVEYLLRVFGACSRPLDLVLLTRVLASEGALGAPHAHACL